MLKRLFKKRTCKPDEAEAIFETATRNLNSSLDELQAAIDEHEVYLRELHDRFAALNEKLRSRAN